MTLLVNNISFSYPKKDVINNIAFSLRQGDYLAVLGTNGAGKSTLLKCLNKILKPQSGVVYINGIDSSRLKGPELAKNIAYVPQSHDCSKKTVFDSILLGRKPYIKWDVTQRDIDIVENVLKLLNLENYSMRYTNELSGGELQKVIIARALVQEPKVLLMDEPTSNLDLKNQIEVLKTIKYIVNERKISAIVAMHDLNLALRFANKFLLLKEGEVFDFGDATILNSELIKNVYDIDVAIEEFSGIPVVIPI
ncbi:ABC transporter ATP-binding protein [Anaerosalibacter bizertensis]|uniref:ABC transporter ATP-binding protein n=1 Tax=Anaerosalibacter bizertensis TaxID=932217 RepID=A0A9Q4AE99_9FIRM|nr:ABC transporter ATP-binding protein [Anaerosalibacter bizertensis]MBV1820738.1 ABC transporter ATP-binding protein [Bacteroidales bacterium MSK.15.36]MCB5559544.1 ABC transporter ATP-binding protein [Anaerosalibacter bizertensis]MCG4566051.1 ABC transporter ATP-binding protein [Anaerosalibacter bizertensis]MCG4583475.1 ABC transporter ATP-binding protein [Anaerosalibacter bizertensis]MCG4585253.1 ABC transporter ATP-binding protein [Anaerosalibacter bizertensis]